MAARAYIFVRENGLAPFIEYVESLEGREVGSVHAAIDRLIHYNGRLPRPYAAHVEGKIWELRTHGGNRVFYFIEEGPDIILLDGHTKRRDRIERRVLERIRKLYELYRITHQRKLYDPNHHG